MLSDAAALSATRFASLRMGRVARPALPGRLGGSPAPESADGFARDLVEAFAAAGSQVRDDFAAHPWIPEAPQMLRRGRDRFRMTGTRGREKIRDLIRHRHQVMNFHRAAPSVAPAGANGPPPDALPRPVPRRGARPDRRPASLARRSLYIQDSWLPSRSSRWSRYWSRKTDDGRSCRRRRAALARLLARASRSRPPGC